MKLPVAQNVADVYTRWLSDDVPVLAQRGTAVVRNVTRTVVIRSYSESSTCSPGDNSPRCQKPVGGTNDQTLPIVLGVVIPISCAIITFLFLHRRNKKRQALEDINDPHKSLDFGLDIDGPLPASSKPKRGRGDKKGAPEMIITDLGPSSGRHKGRGLSMDMLGSPYMLPAGLAGSRESLHSMTRSQREHDPYRPVTFVRNSGETGRRPFHETGSMYSASTNRSFNDRSNLVPNAQRMSQSYIPERSDVLSKIETKASGSPLASPALFPVENTLSVPTSRRASEASSTAQLPETLSSPIDLPPVESPKEIPAEEMPSFPQPPEPTAQPQRPPRSSSVYASALPPRQSSIAPGFQFSLERPMSESSHYDEEESAPPPPPKHESVAEPIAEAGYYEDTDFNYDIDPSAIYTGRHSIDAGAASHEFPQDYSNEHAMPNNRLSYMGVRPLPLDNPEENAEQRANRIRSFYKEYFDTSRPNPTDAYYEDFDAEYVADYYGDEGWYDPETGDYYGAPQAQYAQPMGRRAMTPPPRGAARAPRFPGPYDRHFSTMSGGRPAFRGRPPPKKRLPPPKALTSLPTPHMLRTDSALLNTMDFAPPSSFREQQNGRVPDSPTGTSRPFSPSVRAYNPLLSSFDTLAPIPSPHALRKSGTFTSLDFSPQVPRFLGRDGGSRTGSDAGSIRSARSGISALQMDAVRSGAYRVSRIPKEFVTSREDLTKQLRPKMDLISPA